MPSLHWYEQQLQHILCPVLEQEMHVGISDLQDDDSLCQLQPELDQG